MAILKVAQMGHPILRVPARELTPEEICSPQTAAFVQDMRETMHEYGGLGLAAPQVHRSLRIAVVEIDEQNDRFEVDTPLAPRVYFNPRITVLDPAPFGFWEGCLSVSGLRGYVERPSKIRVDYLDELATPQTLQAEGLAAVALQHELDHLDGVLYVDKLADPTKFAFIEEYGRYHLDDG